MQIKIKYCLSDWQITDSNSDGKSRENSEHIYILLMSIHTDTVILRKN